MRRTTRFSAFGALAALVFATSCDSFLDPSPSDVLAPENFYKTSSDAVAAVNGVYEQVKWSYAVHRRDGVGRRSEEHTSELQSLTNIVCRLLLEKKKAGKT